MYQVHFDVVDGDGNDDICNTQDLDVLNIQ